jgi:glucose uptake protein GlcU
MMYGANFNPPQWRIDHGGSSKDVLDYIFPHFVGIWAMSSALFVLYSAINRNRPAINPSLVLPGFVSGLIWAVSQIGWFVANKYLSPPVSFPIITSGPAVVASLWGVLVFGEIRGKWQILKLIAAMCVTIIGVVLVTLSKILK